MRGVDVRIVTPHIPDKKLIQLVTRGAYPDLLSAGVRIFEYTPGFIHSKQMIVDDRFAAVGTINLDYRSLVHHYENAVLLYRTQSILDIAEDFRGIFQVSREINSYTIKIKVVSNSYQRNCPVICTHALKTKRFDLELNLFIWLS